MKRLIFYFLFSLVFCFKILAQNSGDISLNRQEADMGILGIGSSRTADFRLQNTGSETLDILRNQTPDDCVLRFSSKTIKPGDTAIIRIKYNPLKTGNFKRDIIIYSSASLKPFVLTIKGNVKVIEENMDIACPDFGTPVEEKTVKQAFTVQVIDNATGKPIQYAAVNYNPSVGLISLPTNQNGEQKTNVPIGLYAIGASAHNYHDSAISLYIGKTTYSAIIRLRPFPPKPKDTISKPVIAQRSQTAQPRARDTANTKPPLTFRSLFTQTQPVQHKPVETPHKDTVKPVYNDKPGELSRAEFNPNNIVFLIDVSSSMRTPDKLPLLKIAMIKLLSGLRDIDRVSIVTYAGGTTVLLASTPADHKDEIAAKINELKAYGVTEGGKGIKEAYSVAVENFIPAGNNQIILATDGDFNHDKSDAELFANIKKEAAKGISLSVVGFGQNVKAVAKMEKIAADGQGNYIHIGSENEANTMLIEEIKTQSRKR